MLLYIMLYISVSQPFLPMPHFFHTKNVAPLQHTNKHNQNENFKINGNLLIISETFTLIESFSEREKQINLIFLNSFVPVQISKKIFF